MIVFQQNEHYIYINIAKSIVTKLLCTVYGVLEVGVGVDICNAIITKLSFLSIMKKSTLKETH